MPGSIIDSCATGDSDETSAKIVPEDCSALLHRQHDIVWGLEGVVGGEDDNSSGFRGQESEINLKCSPDVGWESVSQVGLAIE